MTPASPLLTATELARRAGGAVFAVQSRETRYRNDWIIVEHQDVIRPDGSAGIYGVVRIANLAVGVLPVHADGSVELVGQWRHPLGRYSWEMPEGGVPRGETPEDGARRELQEETGLSAAHWLKVLEMDLSNSITDEESVCFVAWGLSPGEASPEPTEVFDRCRIAFADLLAAIGAGVVRDSLTVATALRTHHLAVTGGLPPELSAAILGRA